MVEREELIGETERHPSFADGFAAVGQDRAEAARRALERAGSGIETIGEAGGGRRQRDRRQLAGERDVHQAEVGLKGAVEMRGVGGAVDRHVLARHHQAARTEDILEESGERRRTLLRLRRTGARRDDDRDDDRKLPQSPHVIPHLSKTNWICVMVHAWPTFCRFIVVCDSLLTR